MNGLTSGAGFIRRLVPYAIVDYWFLRFAAVADTNITPRLLHHCLLHHSGQLEEATYQAFYIPHYSKTILNTALFIPGNYRRIRFEQPVPGIESNSRRLSWRI